MRVLRILTRPNVGGPARQALDLWRQDDRVGLQTLLAFGTCGEGETEMELGDLPQLESASVSEASHGLVRVARLGRAARPWRDLRAVHELRQLIRRYRPQVVHTHTSQAGYFGRRAAFAERVPVVAHTFHGHVLADYYPRPISALLRHLEARLAVDTHLLFAVSETCRDELHARGVGAGRIRFLPPAVELGSFARGCRTSARQALGCRDGEFLIGMVGRLVAVKRPEVFVEIVQSMPDARGVVFGSGPLAARMAGQPRIDVRGTVPDLHRFLPGLDALVVCSRREGCPLVALEAFAASVPVVGFAVPGVRDALADPGAGLLVPSAAGAKGIVDALARLRADPELGVRLTQKARTGLDRFTPVAIASQLQAAYADALARRDSGADQGGSLG